ALLRAHSSAGARVLAYAAVRSRAEPAVRLSHARERPRRPFAAVRGTLGARVGRPRGLALSSGARAHLLRRLFGRLRRAPFYSLLSRLRRLGAALDRLPLARRIARVRPGAAP